MKRRYELSDGKSDKFWEIARNKTTVTVRFGKTGTAGQTREKSFDDVDAAKAHVDKLIGEKTRKGYLPTGGADTAAAKGKPAKSTGVAAAKSTKKAGEKPKPPKQSEAKSTRAEIDELSLFRSASFCKQPEYGEVRFLKTGKGPRLFEDPGDLPTDIADWFAEEADDAVIGRLRLEGVRDSLRPIVVIDNEGSVHVTGFSLVDHFGSYSPAAFDGDLDKLLRFCKKHGLPGPREASEIEALAKKLQLRVSKLEKGKIPEISEAALLELRSCAPSLPSPAAKPVLAPGKPSQPKAEFLGWCIGPDGAPWVVTPPKKETKTCKSVLHRWTGSGFVEAGALRGWVSEISAYRGQLAYEHDNAIVLHDGTKETARFPYEGYRGSGDVLLASSEHLVRYCSWDEQIWKLEGDKLVRLPLEPERDATPVMLDEHRLLLVWEERAQVVDLRDGKAKKWPKPKFYLDRQRLALSGQHLVVAGFESLATVAIANGKWSPEKQLEVNLGTLVSLDNGDVLGFASSFGFPEFTDVYRITNKGGKVAAKRVGRLHFARGNKPKAFQHGGSVVVLGGSSGSGRVLVLPEIFDLKLGKGRPVP